MQRGCSCTGSEGVRACGWVCACVLAMLACGWCVLACVSVCVCTCKTIYKWSEILSPPFLTLRNIIRTS